ncbi:MAG: D-alanine--D-alanine ligase [Acidobacteria bacterium]|nr:D-alanine--D-alanine ligase [Acidobacteriota bacterium]
MSRTRKKLRVLVLAREGLIPPDTVETHSEKQAQPWKTEADVISTLKDIGHDVQAIGIYDDLGTIRKALREYQPAIVFNLLEEFNADSLYDQHVVSFLELVRQPYTGCNPRGLTLCHDKALSKQILSFHRIAVPAFAVFPLGRKVRSPGRLKFPLMVKSLVEEGSVAISRASVVHDHEKLKERVESVHRQTGTAAIVEEYIEGREIYVGVIGNRYLHTYPPWELRIEKLPEGAPHIATQKIKWDSAYQERVGVVTRAAILSPALQQNLDRLCKRIYRYLYLSGYARLDFRLTEEERFYLLEANPNPDIAADEDFAAAARHAGVKYESLLHKIITLGLSYRGRPVTSGF